MYGLFDSGKMAHGRDRPVAALRHHRSPRLLRRPGDAELRHVARDDLGARRVHGLQPLRRAPARRQSSSSRGCTSRRRTCSGTSAAATCRSARRPPRCRRSRPTRRSTRASTCSSRTCERAPHPAAGRGVHAGLGRRRQGHRDLAARARESQGHARPRRPRPPTKPCPEPWRRLREGARARRPGGARCPRTSRAGRSPCPPRRSCSGSASSRSSGRSCSRPRRVTASGPSRASASPTTASSRTTRSGSTPSAARSSSRALYVPVTVLLGLGLALLLNQKIRFIGFYRTCFFVPFVASAAATGVIFLYVLDPQYGIVDNVIAWMGFKRQLFLDDPDWALFLLAPIYTWTAVGFDILIYLAALQDVPQDQSEAARIDGAGRFAVFRHVILPGRAADHRAGGRVGDDQRAAVLRHRLGDQARRADRRDDGDHRLRLQARLRAGAGRASARPSPACSSSRSSCSCCCRSATRAGGSSMSSEAHHTTPRPRRVERTAPRRRAPRGGRAPGTCCCSRSR